LVKRRITETPKYGTRGKPGRLSSTSGHKIQGIGSSEPKALVVRNVNAGPRQRRTEQHLPRVIQFQSSRIGEKVTKVHTRRSARRGATRARDELDGARGAAPNARIVCGIDLCAREFAQERNLAAVVEFVVE
jgi:hypothetical protein